MRKELPKQYDPTQVESQIYQMWLDNDCFKAEPDPDKKPYSIVMPPPNVTGQLHMGHALDETLQDILIRAKRMQGYNTLWVPGTDHAGIATQIKVEEYLRKNEGITRYDLGREKFLERVWDWKEQYGNRITSQLKKLGSSCDWSREAFTMSESLSHAVRKVFVSLYNKGLIYRGLRITNVCPHCNTVISDAEVEHKEIEGAFWHIKYPIKGEEGRFVTVATTRPETMLGDTAVAVAPDDERYADLVGKTLILPLVGREIPVIADENVDREFGTGCVKITPAHDPNDYETGLRHNLENIIVLDNTAHINENGGKYQGLDRYEARKQIVADLDALGLLEKVEKCTHNVAHCYRCGTVLEPVASRQWFVKMKPLAAPAIDAVKDGSISYVPDRFSKIYLNWMENIRDWCISRQLWWGHRIPAFYCADCGEMTVSEEDVHVCPKCGSHNMTQDEDVLDTWFSSALWPFTTLGWPEKTEELKKYQEEPTPSEDLKCIPLLTREDMKKEAQPFKNEMKEMVGVPVLHHDIFTNGIEYFRCFFDVKDLEEYTKRSVQCGKHDENKIVRQHKSCLILWRAQCKKNAPARKKPVRGIWGCCSGQGQCLRSYFRRSRSSSRERCFSPWRSLG